MKHLALLFVIAVIFSIAAPAQMLDRDTSTAVKSYSYYIKKRNTNNTIGWVCLGTGVTMMGVGLLAGIGGAFNHTSGTKGDAIAVAGEIVTLASIPFFIIAHHNKKMAALSLKENTVSMGNETLFKSNYVALSIQVRL